MQTSIPASPVSMDEFWIRNGWYKGGVDDELRLAYADWSNPETRRQAVRTLVDYLGKDPSELRLSDFKKNRLSGLISNFYNSSPYEALTDAGFKLLPFEMWSTPRKHFDRAETRAEATRWMVAKLKRKPQEIRNLDFIENGLDHIIAYHKGSPYKALREAGYKIHAFQMEKSPQGYMLTESNRINAIRELCELQGKEPEELSRAEYKAFGLGAMLHNHFERKPRVAALEYRRYFGSK